MQCFGYLILLTHGSQATFLWHFAKLLSTHLQYHISMTKWSYPRMSAAMATISNPAQVIHQNYVKSFQRLHKKFPKILHVNKQKNVKKMVKRQMLMKINAKLHKFSCNRQDISLIIHGACAAASGRPGTPHHTHMKLSCFWAGHNAVILVLILLIRQQTTITISLCPSATSFLVL